MQNTDCPPDVSAPYSPYTNVQSALDPITTDCRRDGHSLGTDPGCGPGRAAGRGGDSGPRSRTDIKRRRDERRRDGRATMADSKAPVERPLSPHLFIYKPTLTMTMSIAHR